MIEDTSTFKNSKKHKKKAGPSIKIFYTGLSLFLFLLAIRTRIVHIEWQSVLSLLTYLPKGFIAAFYDFRFVLELTLVFGIFLYFVRGRRYGKLIYYVYLVIALFTVTAGILNERTIRVIGNPFSYQWLYYSDFMGSQDSQNAMLANISWELSAFIIAICGLLVLTAKAFVIVHNHFLERSFFRSKLRVILITAAIFVVYNFSFNWYKDYRNWQYNQLANPIAFFIESIFQTDKGNLLFSMDVPADFDDLSGSKSTVSTVSLASDSSGQVKNVIFFILESVPAEYLDSYGGTFDVTPEINKLIPNAIRFKNTYAHSPATNNAMVSILGSIYPWISYKSLTKEYPKIKLNSISTLLKQQNYRTAFYSAGDLKFQRGDEFVRNQGFDTMEDFSSKYCKDNQFIVKGKRWENPDGADDECMVKSFSEWIDADRERPFFATLWTVQTHYPYFYSGKEKDYKVDNPLLNRYLNALHHSDQTLGKVMEALKERGLEESTLFVIVGDHGESFGRHNQYTHASKIYEENVHIPLILVNKNLFHGQVNDRVSGQVDIAPTVMSMLKFPVDEQWQGKNLFHERANNRTYFFAPWSDFLFGFRENNLKFIYNATKNTTEVYDLDKDPTEQVNIVNQFPPDYVVQGHKRLAQWLQYQDKFIKASLRK